MLDVTLPDPIAAAETALEQPGRRSSPEVVVPSLLDAALRIATTMQHQGTSLSGTADRIESYEQQPYPMAFSFMSNRVADFLRALDRARQAREDGLPVSEAEQPAARPRYGPPLREVS